MNARELLEAVARGDVAVEEAAERFALGPFAELGFARPDLHRELRNGLEEAVLAQGKTGDELAVIVERMLEAQGRVLATRVAAGVAAELGAAVPGGDYRERSGLMTWGEAHDRRPGRPLVVSAGTSDRAVAEEAAETLAWFGHPPEVLQDVGVAGLERLLSHLELLRSADVVVAVAGMDGALPTVVSGLVAAPVVGVPTSVGYGAAAGGLAPLLTMLATCAPGLGVVNVDNGFGAAVWAIRVLRTTVGR